jgi:hypothetical protein
MIGADEAEAHRRSRRCENAEPYFSRTQRVYTLTVTDMHGAADAGREPTIDAGQNWVGAITVKSRRQTRGIGVFWLPPRGRKRAGQLQTGRIRARGDLQAELQHTGHYTSDCLTCHSVGWDLAASKRGMDDASNYQNFSTGSVRRPHFVGAPNNGNPLLNNLPMWAKLANVLCENATAEHQRFHATERMTREISVPPRLCAPCHASRHARTLQQWQERPTRELRARIWEANVEGRGGRRVICGRCTIAAQGFSPGVSRKTAPSRSREPTERLRARSWPEWVSP